MGILLYEVANVGDLVISCFEGCFVVGEDIDDRFCCIYELFCTLCNLFCGNRELFDGGTYLSKTTGMFRGSADLLLTRSLKFFGCSGEFGYPFFKVKKDFVKALEDTFCFCLVLQDEVFAFDVFFEKVEVSVVLLVEIVVNSYSHSFTGIVTTGGAVLEILF